MLRDANAVNVIPGETLRQRFTVDQSDLSSAEWQAAIEDAIHHQGGRGHYTLFRIKTFGSAQNVATQVAASKLKDLTWEYNGGGGAFRAVQNGEFVLWEHSNSTKRKHNKDPIKVGNLRSGVTELWFPVPSKGDLRVLGDILVYPALGSQRGQLQIRIRKTGIARTTAVVIGPVVVGGPYGTKYPLSEDGESKLIPLPSGKYKILFSDFDTGKGRWDFTIRSGMTTRLEMTASNQKELQRTSETYEKSAYLLELNLRR